MPAAANLPPSLRGRPFLVTEARTLGVTPARLRASDLRSPHRGVRVEASLERTLHLDAAGAALLLPEGSAFAGLTALRLLELPEPWGWSPVSGRPSLPSGAAPAAAPVVPGGSPHGLLHVAVPAGVGRPRVRGVDVRRAALADGTPLVERRGLPVLHPAEVWAQRCADLPLEDAVALGDAVRHRLTSGDALTAAVAHLPSEAQRARAASVLALVRDGVGSPPETRLRLGCIGAGLPEPVCGRGAPPGDHPLAWPDLSWPEPQVAAEVDGLTHLEPAQRHRDVARKRLLEEQGWCVVEVTAREVWRDLPGCVERVRRALTGQRPH